MRVRHSLLTIALAAVAGCHRDAPPSSLEAQPAPSLIVDAGTVPASIAVELADLTPTVFFAQASASVVVVRNPDASSLGSGVEIRPGIFVTNCHVLEAGSRYFVEQVGETYPATLLRADTYRDICLLHARNAEPHPAVIRSAADVEVGERVYAIGNPQGFELTLSEGLVSQLRRITKNQVEPYIQTTAAISQGSSGGGLFDRKGRLIGIPSFMWKAGQSLNFAAPIDWALALADGPSDGFSPVEDEGEPVATATELNAAAITLIREGKPAEAIPLLHQAAALTPMNAEVGGNLGYAYLLTSQYEEARDALLATLEIGPKRSATWLNLGETYAALGDRDAAVRSVVNGYRLSSRQGKVHDALSRVAFDESASAAWKEVAGASLAIIDSKENATSG